jgi:hypothetical protein
VVDPHEGVLLFSEAELEEHTDGRIRFLSTAELAERGARASLALRGLGAVLLAGGVATVLFRGKRGEVR